MMPDKGQLEKCSSHPTAQIHSHSSTLLFIPSLRSPPTHTEREIPLGVGVMLGGRGSSSFRRTTSMSVMCIDVPNKESAPPSPPAEVQNPMPVESDGYDRRSVAMLSKTKNSRRSCEGSRIETACFLKSCGLCSRRLSPACDIYMYRGDSAFCSEECREQRIKQDEFKERRSAAAAVATNISGGSHRSEVVAAAAEGSGKSETVVAA